MKNRKSIAYLLLILSYLIVGFILIYVNSINSNYNNNQLMVGFGIIIVVLIWLFAAFLLSKEADTNVDGKIIAILKHIARLPLYIILIPILIVPAIIQIIIDNFRYKVRPLSKSGFKIRKIKVDKQNVYLLSKENIVIKIKEFDLYEISEDFGNTFVNIEDAKILSMEERGEFKECLFQYYGSDYRDKDLYDPTRKLVSILMQREEIRQKSL